MLKAIADFTDRVRDSFSSAALGTTSAVVPDLGGGIPFRVRLSVTVASLLIAILCVAIAAEYAGVLSLLFFLPALTMAGLFGGPRLAVLSCALAIFIAGAWIVTGADTLYFGIAAALQTALALVLRQFFRESRGWGVRYRRLLSAISSGVVISDMHGFVKRWQPEFGNLLGMDWPLYADMGWLVAVHPDDMKMNVGGTDGHSNVLHREVRLRDPKTHAWRWFLFRSVPVPDRDGKPREMISILTDIHERKLAQEGRDIALGEMRHRLKNLMAVIHSLATSTQPPDDAAVEAYLEKFLGRLHALTAAADQVMVNERVAIEAGAVIRATLAPFMEDNSDRIIIDGPRCLFSEQTGGSLAFGIHELATNAIKYGALSVPSGSVTVRWRCEDAIGGERVILEWIETGGPPPAIPNRTGFGMRVIGFVPARERNGHVDIQYPPEGLTCRITFEREKLPPVPAASE